MRHLDDYKIFEGKFPTSKEEIDAICRKYDIYNYTINDDVSIDVDWNVNLREKDLTELPLKFNRVSGFFNCSDNKLTSLEGSPKYVHLSFDFRHNKITSLEGCPEYMTHVYCFGNPIYYIVEKFIYKKDRNNLIELFNYYDIIQDMDVIYDRLKYFNEGIDVEVTDKMLKEIENNGYKIIY